MNIEIDPPPEFTICHHCRRPLDRQIAKCGERTTGSCPYVVTVQPSSLKSAVAAAGATMVTGILLASSVWGDWLFVPVILTFTLCIVLFILYSNVQYDSPSTSTQWTVYTLSGIPFGQRICIFQQSSHDPGPPSVRLADPASHIAYYQALHYGVRSKATHLFRCALAGLLSSGCLEAALHDEFSRTITTLWHWQRRKVMTFTISESFPRGGLERRMLQAIRTLSSMPSTAVMTPYDIIRETYNEDVADPEKWVVDIVQREVALNGELVGKRSFFRTKYTFEPAGHMRYASQINQLGALEDWMQSAFQINADQLEQQIHKAIKSRKRIDYQPGGW